MNIENTLWIEKHRPRKLEDMVLQEDYKHDFQKWIQDKEVPNVLFTGPPGSGKTTFAKILTSKFGILQHPADNLLEINGSAKETRGISYVQDCIEPFLKIPPVGDNYRIVFIDEGDFLTDAAFSSLRNIIERYSQNGRFIVTCNYISKFPEAIISRFRVYSFKQYPTELVYEYCRKILDSEKIEYEKENIQFVIGGLYPDVRRIVDSLQKFSSSGKLKVNKDLVQTNEKLLTSSVLEIVSYVNKNEMSKIGRVMSSIVNILNEQDLDFRNIYSTLFFHSLVPGNVKIIVNKYSNSHSDCLIPSMHFCGMMFEVINCLKEYRELVEKK